MRTAANILSLARLLAAPLIAAAILGGWLGVAAILFLLAALSDALDGYLARKAGDVSPFGQLLDPIADKALINLCLLAGAATGLTPLWLAALALGRDGLILLASALTRMFRTGHDLAPLLIGKAATFTLLSYLAAVLAGASSGWSSTALIWTLEAAAGLLTLASGLLYTYQWWAHLLRPKRPA